MAWEENELRTLYWDKELSTVEIGEKFGYTARNVGYYMRKFGISRRSNSEAHQLGFRKKPHPGCIHPNLEFNENMAYILGVLFGDGNVNKNGSQYRIQLNNTRKSFAESFAKALRLIGLHPCFYTVKLSKKDPKHSDVLCVVATSKMFYNWFKGLTLIDVRRLLIRDIKYTKGFLRGFYESEGTLQHRTKNCWRIRIYNSNVKILNIIQNLLTYLGFNHSFHQSKRKKTKDEYSVDILGGTKETFRFLSEVNPCIKKVR